MSDPKRYGFPMCECDATDEFHMQEMGMAELKDGGFVLWNDYARLKAEVERLRASSFVTAVPVEEYEKVKEDAALWKLRSDNWQKYVQLLQEEINRLKNAAKDGKTSE